MDGKFSAAHACRVVNLTLMLHATCVVQLRQQNQCNSCACITPTMCEHAFRGEELNFFFGYSVFSVRKRISQRNETVKNEMYFMSGICE